MLVKAANMRQVTALPDHLLVVTVVRAEILSVRTCGYFDQQIPLQRKRSYDLAYTSLGLFTCTTLGSLNSCPLVCTIDPHGKLHGFSHQRNLRRVRIQLVSLIGAALGHREAFERASEVPNHSRFGTIALSQSVSACYCPNP
jgi:hypothetical protein